MSLDPIIAVDIGNSHIGFHVSEAEPTAGVEFVIRSLNLSHDVPILFPDVLSRLGLPIEASCQWWVASVNVRIARQLKSFLETERVMDAIYWIDQSIVPLPDRIQNRGTVGIDRLLAAWNAWTEIEQRDEQRSGGVSGVVVVDVGSAVTVDWVDGNGVFRGGMIYPGLRLSADALHRGTAALPATNSNLVKPAPLGTNTEMAIQAGVYWSQWGALQATVQALQQFAIHTTLAETAKGTSTVDAKSTAPPAVVATGGGLVAFVDQLPTHWQYDPELLARAILRLVRKLKH